jgi:integrase
LSSSIEEVRQCLLQKGLAPSSTNRALAFLRHVLNRAVRDGVLNASPMVQVKFLKESPGRLRFLSLEEESRLSEEIGPPYGAWIRFAILTGLRQMEQFSLRWECVELERGLLTIPHTKGGGPRYVHLNAEAVAILREMTSWMTSQWVLPSENAGSHLDPRHFYARIFLPTVKRLGLEGVMWHTLRHTFASRLSMDGATEQDIAACLGHSTTALVRRYAHLSPSHLKGVVERLSTFGQVRTESRQEESQRSNPTADPRAKSSMSVGTVTKPRFGHVDDTSERM